MHEQTRRSTMSPAMHFTFIASLTDDAHFRSTMDRWNREGLVISHSCGCGWDCITAGHLQLKTQQQNLLQSHYHYVLQDAFQLLSAEDYCKVLHLLKPLLDKYGIV